MLLLFLFVSIGALTNVVSFSVPVVALVNVRTFLLLLFVRLAPLLLINIDSVAAVAYFYCCFCYLR